MRGDYMDCRYFDVNVEPYGLGMLMSHKHRLPEVVEGPLKTQIASLESVFQFATLRDSTIATLEGIQSDGLDCILVALLRLFIMLT